ncbi:MAG: hypothetical protein RLZZ262_2383 [Bacteroidota bacterium]
MQKNSRMEKNKILSQIEARLKSLEAEHKALIQAQSLLKQAESKSKALDSKNLLKLAQKSAKSYTSSANTSNSKLGSRGRRKRSSNGFSKKVIEFFNASGKFLPTSTIATKFKSSYPDKSEVDLTKYLAVILSQQKAKGQLVSYSPDNKGQTGRLLMWGLPEWMNGKKPKPEFIKK